MSHLKRLNAPNSWLLSKRKGIKFIARPLPGPHKLKESITIDNLLKELLNYAKTTREVKLILNNKQMLVNNSPRKEHRFTIGLFDVISFPGLNEFWMLLYDANGKFYLKKIGKELSELKLGKVIGKKILKDKKIQINLHNGNNLLVKKDTFKVGDTLVFKNEEILKQLKFEIGATIYLTSGRNKGKIGVLEKIEKPSELSEPIITIENNKEKIVTSRNYAFVVEKELINE